VISHSFSFKNITGFSLFCSTCLAFFHSTFLSLPLSYCCAWIKIFIKSKIINRYPWSNPCSEWAKWNVKQVLNSWKPILCRTGKCSELFTCIKKRWLRHSATSRKVAGSIPDDFTGNFHWHKSFRPRYDHGVDSASNRNEYQEYFLGVKTAGASGWPYHLHVPIVLKSVSLSLLEPCPGLSRDCFTLLDRWEGSQKTQLVWYIKDVYS